MEEFPSGQRDVYKRQGMACVQTYMGLGLEGYRKAILFLKDYLQHR